MCHRRATGRCRLALAGGNTPRPLHRGERLGIVGGSGSGKTTLLRVLGGLTAPTSGDVRTDGRAVWRGDRPDRGALTELAMVFQEETSEGDTSYFSKFVSRD